MLFCCVKISKEENYELRKTPDVIQASFQIDSNKREVIKCPAGYKPYKTSYYEETGLYRASISKKSCEHCPLREQCGAKLQKKSAYVLITEKMVQRASYLQKLSSEEYRSLSKKRNGVEGLPSVLRRRYHVDNMPVRGLVRSKMWFSLKVGAINVKRVLKRVSILLISHMREGKILFFKKQSCYKTETRLKVA